MKRSYALVSTPPKRSRSSGLPKKKSTRGKVSLSKYSFPGFPRQLGATMRYVQNINLTMSSTVTPAYEQFSVNGLFNPRIGGSGHQPMQMDTFTLVYNNYTVLAARIKVSFTTITSPVATAQVCGIYVEDNTTVLTTQAAMCEQSSAKYTQLNQILAGQTKTLSIAWDAKKVFGGTIVDNDDLGGTISANPVLQQYFTVFCASTSAAVISTVQCVCTIEYDVLWDNLINQASS